MDRPVTLDFLSEQLALADTLLAGRSHMFEPQDLPGRYGRVVKTIDHLLQILQCPAALGGGWAVWHHGFVGRVTQDLNVALAAENLGEFLRTASVSGFELLPQKEGRWSKMLHKDTGIQVDILPEGARPGTEAHPAPTTIPHPLAMGAEVGTLRYVTLASLIELKIAAGRARDESDVVELIRANPDQVETVRRHLGTVHPDYVQTFDRFVERAREQADN